MRRRTFLVLCVGGVGVACVPAAGGEKRGQTPAEMDSPEQPSNTEPQRDAGSPDAAAQQQQADATSSSGEADATSSGEADAASDGHADASSSGEADASEPASPPDAGVCQQFTTMHDTNAQALYFDGTYGPLTGVVTVDYVLANVDVDMEFWHGHNGQQHHFMLKPEHFAALKRGERVMIETTEVDSHTHLLFVDPTDESYRVDGAPDVQVPLC